MDYDKIINYTYSWFSLEKIAWFLIFFWLSVPILFVVPWAIEKQFFNESVSWIVYLLYFILYVGVLLGFMALTCACLGHRKMHHKIPTESSFIDTVLLVFLELWHIFIWNIHQSHRFTQLLLLIGTPLLYFYYFFNPSLIILVSLCIFVVLYFLMVISNSVRLFFTVTIFYNKEVTKKEAIMEAWNLTHGRVIITFFGIALVVGVVFVMFAVIAIILGAIAHILLLSQFTPPVAYELAQSIAVLFALGPAIISYYFGVIEVYNQLEKEKVSSNRINRLLAQKVLSPKKKVVKKKAKKSKKKSSKKSKKKVVKKKAKKSKKKSSKKSKKKNKK